MKVFFIGDIVGRTGRRLVQDLLPVLTQQHEFDLVVANGENAAGGVGITPVIAKELLELGIDVLTGGNHIWDKKELIPYLSQEPRLLRPENYPVGTPGRGWVKVATRTGIPVIVANFSGRVYMDSLLDCPFRGADNLLNRLQGEANVILVDFHAEATSEKQAFGWFLDGRVSAVLGTHTHVQTADERILDQGTAYITDVGMTGPSEGILGVEKDAVIKKFLSQMPQRFEVARGQGMLNGVIVNIDPALGTSRSIKRIYEYV